MLLKLLSNAWFWTNSNTYLLIFGVYYVVFLCSLKKLINLNWRLITLQYCGDFCHISTWISHGCTGIPPSWTPFRPPSAPHASGLSQSTDFECPASCIELVLVIYFTYGNIHVSMLFFHIVPPSPSPTESRSLFITSMSLAVLHIGSSLPSF